jgi:hypothetical protein
MNKPPLSPFVSKAPLIQPKIFEECLAAKGMNNKGPITPFKIHDPQTLQNR